VLSQSDNKILVGGSQGLWIYDVAGDKSEPHEEFAQQALQGAKVEKLHVGRPSGQVLIRLSKPAANADSGSGRTTASYVLFDD